MTSAASVFILTCLIVGETAQTVALESSSSVHHERRETGENLTLQCAIENISFTWLYWFKQTLGEKLRPISYFNKSGNFHGFSGEFNNPRFTLKSQNSKNEITISDLQMSDSATYHCICSNEYMIEILATITVSVKGSGVSVPALVHQSESETIQPGGSVTLNCTVHTGTCDGEHSVYWFRNSEEAHPGLIYTHGGRNDQCERNPHSHTHTCVYNLAMRSLNLSHAGTYYCAVVSCGHILFGDGTKLDFGDEVSSGVLVYSLSGALISAVILIVVLAFLLYKMNNRNSSKSDESSSSTAEDDQNLQQLYPAAVNVTKRSRRQRDLTWSECVYHTLRKYVLATITVSVKGSGVSVPALVHQSKSETIQPGGSVTLNCTVHSRTYYSTVVSCEHILFGDGTKLDFGDEVSSGVLVYSLSGALISAVILIVVLAFLLYKMNKRICFLSPGMITNTVSIFLFSLSLHSEFKSDFCVSPSETQARFSAPSTTNMEGNRGADDVSYAALNVNMPNTSRRQRNTARDECVYSSVRQ
ncbi:uncharacterized protein LOC121504951 [Cheilinus undulatus]|uniref:uncharacterized protein LOC121504951 n=1 Tax=Cheilinus undulatus TaxID=241271 RepID=UPI001BD48E65|nr:uncharacterized protein LOC121504951 [Cheilinus undulatus]